MQYTVYAIRSQSTGKIYIGFTSDPPTRIRSHNQELTNKKSSYTHKNKGPWKYIYTEKVQTEKQARIREKQLKSFRGREYIKSLIKA